MIHPPRARRVHPPTTHHREPVIAFIPLLVAATADKATTFIVLFLAQAASWAGVPALGAAAAGAAGALASHGTIHLWAVLVVGTLGAEFGALGGWWLGNHLARAGVGKEEHVGERRRKALSAGERVEKKWGRLIVFFVPSWVSGALGMRFRQFAPWNLLAAFLWNVGASLAAYGVASGASGKSAFSSVVPLVIGIALLAAIVLAFRSVRRRRHRRAPSPHATV
jgi:membrane protein DedA with SNARE-associated domain